MSDLRRRNSSYSRAQTLLIYTLLYQYALEKFGSIEPVTNLHRAIDDIEADYFRQFTTSEEQVSIVSYPTIQKVVYRWSGDIDDRTADVIVAFLLSKSHLSRDALEEHSDAAVTRFLPVPRGALFEESDMVALEGVYLHEGSGATETLIVCLIISADSCGTLSLQYKEKLYKRQANPTAPGHENGAMYQRRINEGDADEEASLFGLAWKEAKGARLALRRETTGRERSTRLFGELTYIADFDVPQIAISLLQDLIKRRFVSFTQRLGKKSKRPENLTKRYRNNIISKERFVVDPIDRFTVRMELSTLDPAAGPLSETDALLLRASLEGDAATMVSALLNGADINAQDRRTGATVLHNASRSLSPIALSVLTPVGGLDEEFDGLLDYLVAENDPFDRVKAEVAVRRAQQHLNPLLLDNVFRFASAEIDISWDPEVHMSNPTERHKNAIFSILCDIQEDALRAAGLSPTLHFLSPDHVRAAMTATAIHFEPPSPH